MKSISPLRYPGGKSSLYNGVEQLVVASKAKSYAEPFSGGFGIGLLLLVNNIVEKVHINDLDINIYSFWKCIKSDAKHLILEIERISKFNKLEQWIEERETQLKVFNSNIVNYRKRGFATLFLNRVNWSGILKGGPIGGVAQSGKYKINCRFNAQRLIEKIKIIENHKKKIYVTRKKYQKFLNDISNDAFIFLDPPYVAKGVSLYLNNFVVKDHLKVERHLRNLKNLWVMTYDSHELIKKIYSNDKIYIMKNFSLNYYAGAFKLGSELLIYPKRLEKFFQTI